MHTGERLYNAKIMEEESYFDQETVSYSILDNINTRN